MFDKVLVLDDIDSINIGVKTTLNKMDINNVHDEQYCDTAYLKIKKALIDKEPFDLLISDLSFIKDHRQQRYEQGENLIKAVKEVQPDLKIIVYSIEDKYQTICTLVNDLGVNAYVCKSRSGLNELKEAIEVISENKTYLSARIENALNEKSNLDITQFDIIILKMLSLGNTQLEISKELNSRNISPNSLRSVEKRINLLKDQFNALNAVHLVSIVKDLGII